MDGPASGDPTGVRPARSVVGNEQKAMKVTKDDIILERVLIGPANRSVSFLVKSRHNFTYGFIRKLHDTKTTKHPWQAYRYFGANHPALMGSFYGDSGKAEALDAILKSL